MVLGMTTKFQRRKALKALPPDLYGSFRGIITRIRECPIGNQAELGMRVLMWLHFAYRPLQLVELQHALAVEVGHTEFEADNIPSRKTLLDCCLGLAVVDDETLTVRFVHYTVEEYFRDNTKTEFPNGCSSIAETCLTYLNFGTLRQHCMDSDSLDNIRNNYAFLNYAALYWGTYFKQQGSDALTELIIIIVDHKTECPPCAIQALYRQLSPELSFPQRFSGIHAIAYFGLSDIMVYLSQREWNMELKDDCAWTPLSWAAEAGHEAVVRQLIERGDVNINTKDTNRHTPLSLAAGAGHEAVVRLLVERSDVDIDSKNKRGRTPLFLAVENEHVAVVRLLVGRSDVDINAKSYFFEQTPLTTAAENGNEAIVRLLIGRDDVDINFSDWSRRTPLLLAVASGHVAVVRLLVGRSDADINAKTPLGRTSLAMAAAIGNETIVRLLIGRDDIDINTEDIRGLTPLSFAAQGGYEAIVRLLINRDDIDINAEDIRGQTPLSYAAQGGYEAIVRLLQARSLDPVLGDVAGASLRPRAR